MRRVVLAVIIGVTVASCGKAASRPPAPAPAQLPNQILAINGAGAPRTGGTLTMLGTEDVDYIDPNISYTAVGYLDLRMWSRGLYAYPASASAAADPVPDLATALPVVSDGGLRYTVTIRKGAMWDTDPPRQVTAADVVRGVERSCSPGKQFGGQLDFDDILAGYGPYCAAFQKVAQTPAAEAAFIGSGTGMLTGVQVDPRDPSGLTVQFTLLSPATYFTDILTLPPFSPAPVETLAYLPGSAQLAQHTVADGPYRISSYVPGVSITYLRNPAWQASTDPLRHAYVDRIVVNETGRGSLVYQQVMSGAGASDMEWNSEVPVSAIPSLIADRNPDYSQQSDYSDDPYIVWNTASPNQGAALAQVKVRRALAQALDRDQLVADLGGAAASPPLNEVLPPGVLGSTSAPSAYPYDPAAARPLLKGLKLKMVYADSSLDQAVFDTVKSELAQVGVTVSGTAVPLAELDGDYLDDPGVTRAGGWDLALTAWHADWMGDAAKSFFLPLFDGRNLPPSSNDYGLFDDPALTPLIQRALAAGTPVEAAGDWHQADQEVMSQAAIYPISAPNEPMVHGSNVHDCFYVPALGAYDPTNVWLSS